jgi:hypothetical protein
MLFMFLTCLSFSHQGQVQNDVASHLGQVHNAVVSHHGAVTNAVASPGGHVHGIVDSHHGHSNSVVHHGHFLTHTFYPPFGQQERNEAVISDVSDIEHGGTHTSEKAADIGSAYPQMVQRGNQY